MHTPTATLRMGSSSSSPAVSTSALPVIPARRTRTNDLSAAHSLLPSIVVNSKQKITSIENPDDNLDSLLSYLIKEGN